MIGLRFCAAFAVLAMILTTATNAFGQVEYLAGGQTGAGAMMGCSVSEGEPALSVLVGAGVLGRLGVGGGLLLLHEGVGYAAGIDLFPLKSGSYKQPFSVALSVGYQATDVSQKSPFGGWTRTSHTSYVVTGVTGFADMPFSTKPFASKLQLSIGVSRCLVGGGAPPDFSSLNLGLAALFPTSTGRAVFAVQLSVSTVIIGDVSADTFGVHLGLVVGKTPKSKPAGR